MKELAAQVRAAIEPLADVGTLVLFGSRARGTARADSDLDVAVLPARESRLPRWQLQGRVASELADLAPEGRVDVVLLDEAPALLRQRIMESGQILFCREPGVWRDQRVATMREHGDMEWMRRRYRQAQVKRLQGRTEGEERGRSGRAVQSLERLGWLSG